MMELKDCTTLIVHGTIVEETIDVIVNCINSGLPVIYSGWVGKILNLTHENLVHCYSWLPQVDPDGRNATIISSRRGLEVSKTKYSWLMTSSEFRPINTHLSSFAQNNSLGKRLFTPTIYENIPFAANLSMFGSTNELRRVFSCELDDDDEIIIPEPETYILANYMDFYSTLVCNMRIRRLEYLVENAVHLDKAIQASNVTMYKYFRKF